VVGGIKRGGKHGYGPEAKSNDTVCLDAPAKAQFPKFKSHQFWYGIRASDIQGKHSALDGSAKPGMILKLSIE